MKDSDIVEIISERIEGELETIRECERLGGQNSFMCGAAVGALEAYRFILEQMTTTREMSNGR